MATSFAGLALMSCSVTGPITGNTVDGKAWSGTYYADTSVGTFQMSDGRTNCDGTYDQYSSAKRLDLAFTCDDGRIGKAYVVRGSDLLDGSGEVTFSDGLTGDVSISPPA